MSYSEICDQFGTVTQHLKEGGQMLTELRKFFRGFKSASDVYALKVRGLSEQLAAVVGREATMDTLSNAVNAFAGHFRVLAASYTQFGTSLQLDIYEPLELFLEHFDSQNASSADQGLAIHRQLTRFQEQVAKTRSKYFRASEAAQKARSDKSISQVIYSKGLATKAMKEYMQAIQESNASWDDYEHNMPEIMVKLQHIQESRINFVKTSLEKYVKHHQTFVGSLSSFSDNISALLGNINSNIDVRVFVDVHKSGAPTDRDEFQAYEPSKPQEGGHSLMVFKAIDQLGDPANDFVQISELMHTYEGRKLFVDALQSRRPKKQLELEGIIQLAALSKSMLTAMAMQDAHDPESLCKILTLAKGFYSEEGGRRRYLASYLSHHSIWMDPKRWVSAIEFAVGVKSLADRESISRIQRRGGLMSTLKSFANKLPGGSKDPAQLRAEKTATYMIASQYSAHMISMGLPAELASQVLIGVAQKVGLDQDRTCHLLAELQANQTNQRVAQAGLSVAKRHRAQDKWGKLLPIVLALPFVDDRDLAALLHVCKEFSTKLRSKVARRRLVGAEGPLRSCLWRVMLGEAGADYSRILSEANPQSDLKEVIDMDVSRSFRNNQLVDPQAIKNILKAYAHYHPEVGYCQGMNYLAGTLFMQFQDEAAAFNCLSQMIHKLSMKDLLVSSMPKLKQFFYQLDRLIAMELPRVHEAFKEAGICAGHFSSSWFITVFAISLQSNLRTLFVVWDMFIAQGWKVVFKTALAILRQVQEEIASGSFDDIMFLFGSLNKAAKQKKVFDEGFAGRIEEVRVSNCVLRELEEEYRRLQAKANYTDKLS